MSEYQHLTPLIEAIRRSQPEQEPVTRLATVTGGGTDQVFVRFDGESATSGRPYKRHALYYPVVNDRVLLLRAGSSWVVVGKIGQSVDQQPGVNVPNMPQTLQYSRLQRIGNHVDWEVQWRVTATLGDVSFWMTLPYAARMPIQDLPNTIGTVSARRTGLAYTTGLVVMSTSADTAHFCDYNGTRWSGTSPFSWGANDDFHVRLSYFTTDA